MSEGVETSRWSISEFLRAWEAGAFDHRVELINGEVWPVVIGDWHGKTSMRVARRLPDDGAEITQSTLPTGRSLPDPDCWVRRAAATPSTQLTRRLSAREPTDVLLIVEVSDETVLADLNVKAKLYASAGYPVYWVVADDAIYEHTEPSPAGYGVVGTYRSGQQVPVRYAGTEIAVDDLIATV